MENVPVPRGYRPLGKSLAKGELYTNVPDDSEVDESLVEGDPAVV
jgi:hypothetical protein